MVQALLAHGADPALGDGVGVRSLDRREDDRCTDRTPEVVEGPGELAVTVADQEPDGGGLLIERGDKVAGLLRDPGSNPSTAPCSRRSAARCRGLAGPVTAAGPWRSVPSGPSLYLDARQGVQQRRALGFRHGFAEGQIEPEEASGRPKRDRE